MSLTTVLKDHSLKIKPTERFPVPKMLTVDIMVSLLSRNSLTGSAFKYISHQRTVSKND